MFDEGIFKNRVAFMKSHIYAVCIIFVCVIIYNNRITDHFGKQRARCWRMRHRRDVRRDERARVCLKHMQELAWRKDAVLPEDQGHPSPRLPEGKDLGPMPKAASHCETLSRSFKLSEVCSLL